MKQLLLIPNTSPNTLPAPAWQHTARNAGKAHALIKRFGAENLTTTEKHILFALACGGKTPRDISPLTNVTPATIAANLKNLSRPHRTYDPDTHTSPIRPPVVEKMADRTWRLTDYGRSRWDYIIYGY